MPEPDVLSPWDRVQIARNAARPHTLHYVNQLCADFVEFHGDRAAGDDQALVGGLAHFRGRSVMIIGHQKGENTKENIARNFGMPKPTGYRKALRLTRHAEKFRFPIITFVDTPGADPGLASEEGGQAFAIADNIYVMATLETPIISVVIGEGGSGGALAIGVADRVLMLENSVYSVASPEAAAAILWKDAARAPEAAAAMRVTAPDLYSFGLVDDIVPEPTPAHEDPATTMNAVGDAIERHLDELSALTTNGPGPLLQARYAKYRAMGRWTESEQANIAVSASRPS